MKIVWKGLLNRSNPLPSPPVPDNTQKLFDDGYSWRVYLLIIPLLLIAYLCILTRQSVATGPKFIPWALYLGVGLSLLFLIVHELIHALCCPKNSEVLAYLAPTGICLIPTCPLKKRRYITMAIMPTLVLGVCPLVAWLLLTQLNPVASSIIFAFSIGSLSMSIGDIYNVLCAARKMTKSSLLITSGSACYYYENAV